MSSAVKVSVVVPVYNPGRYLQPNIESLLAQSLPNDQYEIVYVDDGSTDDSPAVLDRLASEHSNVRVCHQPNSGWPGKPRNVGVDMARGEYVQFVDQDDELAPLALERLYAIGSANRSDIVLSKVTGTMAGPSNVFRRTIDACDITSFPLNESLTPHKFFRREFLLEEDLRFAEGKRRLEDQLFMIQAYLAAKTVSIIGDYPCYIWHRRDDGKNTSSTYTRPRDYFENLREVLDAIVARTEPGELRNRLLRRHYRVEILGRVREPSLLRYSPARRQEAFEVVRKLTLERFSSGEVQAGLAPIARLRAWLLEHGELEGLIDLAGRCDGIRGRATLNDVGWRDGRLRADVRLELRYADGSPVVLERRSGRWLLDPKLTDGLPGVDGWDVGDPLEHVQAEIRMLDRDNQLWWFPEDTLSGVLVEEGSASRVVVEGTVTIDPLTLAGGRPMPRSLHDVWTSFQILGVGRGARLGAERALSCSALRPALVGAEPLLVAPYWTAVAGNLSLDVGGRGSAFLTNLAHQGIKPPRGSRRDEVPLQVATAADSGSLVVGVAVRGREEILEGQIRGDGAAGAVLSLPVATRRFALSLLDADGAPSGPVVDVAPAAWVAVLRQLEAKLLHSPRVRRTVRRLLALVLYSARVRNAARKLLARLPPNIAVRIRRAAARF